MDKINPDIVSGQVETARYISGISKELRILAAKADLTFLSYLLSMAEEEAVLTARGTPSRNDGPTQSRRAS
ncbi:MAG: hypothetical protein ACTSU0_03585 [Alphaproteobacteria bacterium]